MIAAGEADDGSGLILITDAKAAPKGGLMRIEVSEDAAQGLVDMLTRLIATRRQRRAPVRQHTDTGMRPISEASYLHDDEPIVPMAPATGPVPHLRRLPFTGPVQALMGDESASSAAARDEREIAERKAKEKQEKRRAEFLAKRGNATATDEGDAGEDVAE